MSIRDMASTRDEPLSAAAVHSEQSQADKRKRRSAPKVRTGCSECKSAHIRCDEKQPSCGRCQRRKTTCLYQPVAQHRKRDDISHKTQYRVLLPAATVVRPSRLVQPSFTFLNPREVQYFDTFRHSVIFQLGYGNNEFWRRTVLRESSRDDCIRNAVVAVGALVRAQEEHDQVSTTKRKKEWTAHKPQLPLCKANPTSSSSHYFHALTHYTKAVASFRRLIAIASQKNDSGAARAVLIATILLVAFESLQGNTPSADQLGARTLALLQHNIMQGTLRGASNQNKIENPPASQIAGSIDDEGTYDTELMLVRNTFFSSGLSPAYPKAREVVTGLARITPTRGPLPPGAEVDIVVFSRLWSRCLMLSAFWYVRMVHITWGTQQPDNNDANGSSPISDPWAQYRHEQADIMKTLESWKLAAEKRIVIVNAQLAALAASNIAPVNATKLAAAQREVITYEEIAVAVLGCYLSVCTVFDKCGKTWEQHEAVTEDVVGRIERMLSRKKVATATSDHTDYTIQSDDMNSGCYQLRHYYGGFEGSRLILAHIASVVRKPELRKRLMDLWRSELDSRSHWDIQGNYLGFRAAYEVEEAQRDKVTGELPMEKQYHWMDGKWSEDYADFVVTLIAKAPGENGVPEMKVVVMKALKP